MQEKRYRRVLLYWAVLELAAEIVMLSLLPSAHLGARACAMLAADMLCSIVLVILLYACCKERGDRTREKTYFVWILFVLHMEMLLDILFYFFNGNPAFRTANFIINTIYIAGSVLLFQLFYFYIHTLCSDEAATKGLDFTIKAASVLSYAFLLGNLFYPYMFLIDSCGIYRHAPTYPVWYLFVTAMFIPNILKISRTGLSLSQRLTLYSYIGLPMLALVLQNIPNVIFLQNAAEMIAALLLFVNIHIARNRELMEERARQAEQNAALEDARTKLVLSQIRPHFLYNTLGAITYLCGEEPKQARELSLYFTEYLRANLSALDSDRLVSFEKELRHVQTYLYIESVRFARRLQVRYQISAIDFKLPVLTVEPLVENAVKHGVCKKRAGGTVIVSARENAEAYCVTVQDDGVGFDVAQFDDTGPDHVGLRSVRRRIETLCGGTLEIESEVGSGTVATLTIPKHRSQ